MLNEFSVLIKVFKGSMIILIATLCFVGYKNQEMSKKIEVLKAQVISRNTSIVSLMEHMKTPNNTTPEVSERDHLYRDMHAYILKKYSKADISEVNSIVYYIDKYSFENNIPTVLILAMIEAESSMNPRAISTARARGLMQVMPAWVHYFDDLESKEDLYDIEKNIRAGTEVLKIHLKENKGNLKKALNDYSNGDQDYIKKIFYNISNFTLFRMEKIIERDNRNG